MNLTYFEYLGEQTDPKPIGSVEINTEHDTRKKPAWLVLLKLFGLLAIFAVGYLILLPSIPLPLWQSAVMVTGVLLVYSAAAFFLRPEPNTDNLGWLGGFFDDPFHYSDDVNRWLWGLHMLLGPGRFVSETILDTAGLVGLFEEPENWQAFGAEGSHKDAAGQGQELAAAEDTWESPRAG
ncbi:MAG: hypothetical protein ACYC35_22985 [Pirellulales bacterium]